MKNARILIIKRRMNKMVITTSTFQNPRWTRTRKLLRNSQLFTVGHVLSAILVTLKISCQSTGAIVTLKKSLITPLWSYLTLVESIASKNEILIVLTNLVPFCVILEPAHPVIFRSR
jgi:hypothetical protein